VTDARQGLVDRVVAWMDGALVGAPPEPFEQLALAIHAHQHAHDPLLARLRPTPATRWQDIPAIPVDTFKQLAVGTVQADDAGVVFRTSGTTQGARGVHRLRDTRAYDHGSMAWARRCVPDMPAETLALLPDPATSPDSSLSHMVAGFAPAERTSWHLVDGRVDHASLTRAIQAARRPVFLCSTAFALADALEHDLPALPEGSLVMVTGGFKGRRTQVSESDLHEAATHRLGAARVVLEYGMTELSSQLWGHPDSPYQPPPWLRVVAVDPATGAARPPGQAGQLRFFDLANVDSTLCIDTLDGGVVHGDGSLTLHGRLAGAEARGCSLPVEEAGFGGGR